MVLQRRMRIVEESESKNPDDTSIRVAFASSDMQHVNQHFGSAKCLVIYSVNPEHTQLVEVAGFDYENHGDNEDKLGEKIEVLLGCVAVYSQAVGSSAAQKLLSAGVQPVKVHDGAEIAELLKYLQSEMLQGPSAWLAKAITRQKNPDLTRFESMEFEGWDE